MSFQPTPADVSLIISTASSTSSDSANDRPSFATERRITPSWTITELKAKLETMTGIPPGSQRLLFKSPGKNDQWIEGDDTRVIGEWGLVRGCEIEVCMYFLLYFLFSPISPLRIKSRDRCPTRDKMDGCETDLKDTFVP